MRLSRVRFTLWQIMTVAAVVAILLALSRVDVDDSLLLHYGTVTAVSAPVLTGISFDRARGGLGIKGGAIAGLLSFSAFFAVAVAVVFGLDVDAKERLRDIPTILYWFGLTAASGVAFGAVAGAMVALLTRKAIVAAPPGSAVIDDV